MRWLVVLLVACTPKATQIDAEHPANPASEAGRLAGPPAALRPGVVETAQHPAPKAAPKPEPHRH